MSTAKARSLHNKNNALPNIYVSTVETEASFAQEIVDSALISALSVVTGDSVDQVIRTLNEMENNHINTTVTVTPITRTIAPENLKSAMNTRGRKISADGRKRSVTFDPKFIKDTKNSTEDDSITADGKESEREQTVYHPHIQQPPTITTFQEDDESDPEIEITRL